MHHRRRGSSKRTAGLGSRVHEDQVEVAVAVEIGGGDGESPVVPEIAGGDLGNDRGGKRAVAIAEKDAKLGWKQARAVGQRQIGAPAASEVRCYRMV